MRLPYIAMQLQWLSKVAKPRLSRRASRQTRERFLRLLAFGPIASLSSHERGDSNRPQAVASRHIDVLSHDRFEVGHYSGVREEIAGHTRREVDEQVHIAIGSVLRSHA